MELLVNIVFLLAVAHGENVKRAAAVKHRYKDIINLFIPLNLQLVIKPVFVFSRALQVFIHNFAVHYNIIKHTLACGHYIQGKAVALQRAAENLFFRLPP